MLRSKFWSALSGFSLILTISMGSSAALANDAARDLMIEKLNRVVMGLAESDPARAQVTLRLADLLSERARSSYREELEGVSTSSQTTRSDRERALRFYREALPKIEADSRSKVLIQMGHLQQMNGQESEAIKTYASIQDPQVAGEAALAIAEIHFKKNRYAEAEKFYERTLASSGSVSKGYATYRLAWTRFYTGKKASAAELLEKILNTPALLNRSGSTAAVEPDSQFQEEVSRDLVTFLVQSAPRTGEAELIFSLTPENARLGHLFYMATELERLGQKERSLVVYRYLLSQETRLPFKLESQVRVSQLEMELKNTDRSLVDYETALNLWPEVCGSVVATDMRCKEIAVRLKNYIIDWHKIEKKSPSEGLEKAYAAYLRAFQDVDLFLQGALLARERKNFEGALAWLEKATLVLAASANSPAVQQKLETVLLARIETAELSQSKEALKAALEGYLAQSKEGRRRLDVEYQLAKLKYDSGDLSAAAEALRAVAGSNSSGTSTLKLTAAELSLDALALLKDNVRIQAWAGEYAQKFPKERLNFEKVSAKASLNQAAELGASNPAAALAALGSVSAQALSSEEKVTLLKNRILLFEKTEKWSEARLAADELIALGNLKTEDKDFGLEHRARLAELSLDFKKAFLSLKQMSTPPSNYRMALMADLAKEDPTPYLRAQLKASESPEEKMNLASQLILESRNPEQEWVAQKTAFSANPEKYADLGYAVFSRNQSPVIVQEFKKRSDLKNTDGLRLVLRTEIFDSYEKLNATSAAHILKTTNDRVLAQSIRERAQIIENLEKLSQDAIRLGDFSSQVLTLSLLGREEQRFYSDLMGLPLPQGLSPEEERQYMSMLSEQASPHRVRAEDITAKLKTFWAETAAFEALKNSYTRADSNSKKLIEREFNLLKEWADDQKKTQWNALLQSPAPKAEVLVVGLEAARENLRKDPMNPEKMKVLMELEKQSGRDAMVTYLQQRIETVSPRR